VSNLPLAGGYKFRIRAENGSYFSAWGESNQLLTQGLVHLNTINGWVKGLVWTNIGGAWAKAAKGVFINNSGVWRRSK
jgi:hypothetical protein